MKRSITNHNYFDTFGINQAYIAGFLMGDGNIGINDSNNRFIQISLNVKDIEILEFISREICNNRKITRHDIIQKSGYVSNMCKLKITSNILCDKLSKIGIIPNKTGYEVFPYKLDNKLWPHYLRGLFDADGCITKRKDENTYKFSINSKNKQFLEDIRQYMLNGLGKVYNGHGCFSYEINKTKNIIEVRDYIYNDAIFFLKRKKEIFDSVKNLELLYTAFNEEKTIMEWSKDNRCIISSDGIRYRLKYTNLSFEEILTTKQRATNIGDMFKKNKSKS